MPDARPPTPPLTPSQRERIEQMQLGWRDVWQESAICTRWEQIIADIREGRETAPALEELSWQIYQRAPALLGDWGQNFAVFVQAYTHCLAFGEWPTWTPRTAMHLAPENHKVVALTEGGFYVCEDATDADLDQLKAYLRWLRAAPRGRTKGTTDQAPRQAPRRLDPELARRAYELDGQRTPGQSRLSIAQALGLPYDRQDPQARDAMRKRLERLIHHHELTLQKKFGRQ